MQYPLRSDYETAVRKLDTFVYDSVLKSGKPVVKTQDPNFLRSYSGGKAVVFEIKTNSKKYALKCWVEDLGNLKNRYKEIEKYLKKSQLPYFVDFSYNEQGIFVKNTKLPIVRMEWVEGINLKTFIDNNINQTIHIRNLAEKFLEMVKTLHQEQISHGDLQHGNIMIRKDGTICLIDYDSLYVPQLSNEEDNIKGLPGYQHPKRNDLTKLSPKVDYFSELVIYLSLLILAEEPSYWPSIKGQERLLFSYDDLVTPYSSKIFRKLKNHSSDEIQYFTKKLENFCTEPNIENLIPLEYLVNDYGGTCDLVSNGNTSKPNLHSPQPVNKNNTLKNDWDSKFSYSNKTVDWDSKFDPKTSVDWSKTSKPTPHRTPDPDHRKNTYEKLNSSSNENIWDKFFKSVSSIWQKLIKWLTS